MQRSGVRGKTIFIDSAISGKKSVQMDFDLELVEFVKKHRNKSWLFSDCGKTDSFVTNGRGLYFSQEELRRIRKGEKILHITKKLDCFLPREIRNQFEVLPKEKTTISQEIKKRYAILEDYWSRLWDEGVRSLGLSKAWSVSIVCSLIFGMFLMTMLYRYLGQQATAETKDAELALKNQSVSEESQGKVAGAETSKADEEITQKLLQEYEQMLKDNKDKNSMEDKVEQMVRGYPIEKMVPEIMKKDKIVSAFLIGIAMKESTWGKHVPVLDGQDCYNYWGYRGQRARMGTGGHTCFDSPTDAVNTVAKRIEFLVNNEKISTPEQMVTIWKCGYDCSWDSKQAVQKWVSDVDKYFNAFNEKEAS